MAEEFFDAGEEAKKKVNKRYDPSKPAGPAWASARLERRVSCATVSIWCELWTTQSECRVVVLPN